MRDRNGTSVRSVCIFCLEKQPIKRSHVIPEYLYEMTYDTAPRQMCVVDCGLNQNGVRQSGFHESLLCPDCEGYFNDNFEKPCINFFRSLPDHAAHRQIVKVPPVPALPLLLISIAFRAAHCSGEEWHAARMGPHVGIWRECLLEKKIDQRYVILVHGITSPAGEVMKGMVATTQRSRINGHDILHFAAYGMQFIIKVSSHDLPEFVRCASDFRKPFDIVFLDNRIAPSLRTLFSNK